jgi:hypothetical protein
MTRGKTRIRTLSFQGRPLPLRPTSGSLVENLKCAYDGMPRALSNDLCGHSLLSPLPLGEG